jgi:hypothetical protein
MKRCHKNKIFLLSLTFYSMARIFLLDWFFWGQTCLERKFESANLEHIPVSANWHVPFSNKPFLLLFLFFYLDVLGPLVCFPSELMWSNGSYKELVVLLGRGDRPCRNAAAYTGQQDNRNREEHGQISMSRLGLEPRIPLFERAKTFHASNCAAAVIGRDWPIQL